MIDDAILAGGLMGVIRVRFLDATRRANDVTTALAVVLVTEEAKFFVADLAHRYIGFANEARYWATNKHITQADSIQNDEKTNKTSKHKYTQRDYSKRKNTETFVLCFNQHHK